MDENKIFPPGLLEGSESAKTGDTWNWAAWEALLEDLDLQIGKHREILRGLRASRSTIMGKLEKNGKLPQRLIA